MYLERMNILKACGVKERAGMEKAQDVGTVKGR